MAKTEIDNVKMWESMLKNSLIRSEQFWLIALIRMSLRDQGLKYKDGHIISILEQEKVPQFELREGNSYICIAPYKSFKVGEIYHCKNDYHLFDGVATYYPGSPEKYFRPATEEEIIGNKYEFKIGDNVSSKYSGAIYHIQGIVGDYYCTDCGVSISVSAQDNFELVEPKQENIPTFKELERNGKDELSEFEQMLVSLILRTEKTILTPDGLAKEFAPKLINLARQQIASEIDVDAMVGDFFEENTMYTSFYRQGIEDVLKKIKEG